MSSGERGERRRIMLAKGKKVWEVRNLTTNTTGCSAWRGVDGDGGEAQQTTAVAGVEDEEEDNAAAGSGST